MCGSHSLALTALGLRLKSSSSLCSIGPFLGTALSPGRCSEAIACASLPIVERVNVIKSDHSKSPWISIHFEYGRQAWFDENRSEYDTDANPNKCYNILPFCG